MTGSPTPCPACTVPGEGPFCAACGAARDARWCAACGAAIAPGGRFCQACGAGAATRPTVPPPIAGAVPLPAAAGTPGWPYVVVGVLAVAAILALVWPRGPAASPPQGATPIAAAGGDATAIDLSTMTPREQFDRLYDRVMRAAENGDDATVTQFSPMALQAYANLLPGDIDADARYHAAMIQMHTDDLAGAAALADTIRAEAPDHLFSYVIHGTLARQRGDTERLRTEQAEFLKRYAAEMAAERPEYGLHTFILDQFVGEARAASGN